MVNIKARVISFPNKHGRKVFDTFFQRLKNGAMYSQDGASRFSWVLSAIDLMRYVDLSMLPQNEGESFKQELTIILGGVTYSKSFELIKPLRKENIYELRIDFDEPFYWRFRVIFFPYVHNGLLFHCFVFPFEKNRQVRVNLTNQFRDDAFLLYHDLQGNPQKYMNCFE